MANQDPTSRPADRGFSEFGALQQMWLNGQLAWRLFQDDQVPAVLKVIPLLGLAYVVSPIDLVLDLVPVLGQMDDIAVIAFALKTFIDLAPKDRVVYHQAALRGHSPTDEEQTIEGRYKA
jgi:uncharacterized membrane protein YkvA (DUF1232 family)